MPVNIWLQVSAFANLAKRQGIIIIYIVNAIPEKSRTPVFEKWRRTKQVTF
jgi:hypothetical protein